MAEVQARRYSTRSRTKTPVEEDVAAPAAPVPGLARPRRQAAVVATAATSALAAQRRRKTTLTVTTEERAPASAVVKRTASAGAGKPPSRRSTAGDGTRRTSKRTSSSNEVGQESSKKSGRSKGGIKKSPKPSRIKKRVTFHSPSMKEVNKENKGPKNPTDPDAMPKRGILSASSTNVLPPPSPPKRATTPTMEILEDEEDELNTAEPLLNSPSRRSKLPLSATFSTTALSASPVRNAPPVRPTTPGRSSRPLSSISLAPPSSKIPVDRSPIRPNLSVLTEASTAVTDEVDELTMSLNSLPVRPAGGICLSPKKNVAPPAYERDAVRNTPARRPLGTPAKPLSSKPAPTPVVNSVRATPARRPAGPRANFTAVQSKKENAAPVGSQSVRTQPLRPTAPVSREPLKIPMTLKAFNLSHSNLKKDEEMEDKEDAPVEKQLFTTPKNSSTPKMSSLAEFVASQPEENDDDVLMDDDCFSRKINADVSPTPAQTKPFCFSRIPVRSPSASPVSSPVDEKKVEFPIEASASEEKREAEEQGLDIDAEGDTEMVDSPEPSPPTSPDSAPAKVEEQNTEEAQTPKRQGYGLFDIMDDEPGNDTISPLRDSGAYTLVPLAGQLGELHLNFEPVKASSPRAQLASGDENAIPIDPALLSSCDGSTIQIVPVRFDSSPDQFDQENHIPSSPESRAEGIIGRIETARGRSPRRRTSTPGILAGAVVYVDVYTQEGEDVSSTYADMLNKMGARTIKRWDWNPSEGGKVGITHVVFKDGSPKTLEKVRKAVVVQCVGIGWVVGCSKEQTWLDEADFAVDTDCVPRGGGRRRQSMEPKLAAAQMTPAPQQSREPPATVAHSSTVLYAPQIKVFQPSSPADSPQEPPQPAPPATPARQTGVSFAPMTCPPKNVIESEAFQQRLLAARRKSLQWKPKIGSPLARVAYAAAE